MKNFLLLFSGGSGMAGSEEAQKAIMAEWGMWFGSLGANLVDGGSPFMGAKDISASGQVSGGAMDMMGPTGYSVIKAESLDAAVAIAQRCPVLKSGARITVFDPAAVPGM